MIQTRTQIAPLADPAKGILAGRIISGILITLLTMDGVMKLFRPAPVIQATVQLGYPETAIVGIGLALLGGVILYAFRKTAFFGAILLTAYLGGAVATHVRVSAPAFNIVLPILLGSLVWLGLALRDSRVREMILGKS